ncbi:hypothetical protein EVJ58_g7464 [Rhodofomes roseus]|uniref:Chromo domain-containing protein n=1 Tax=Rhodofomes roseus TaxID=34475 RepID=A0A4Y9Y539_9APHY|nr:hypothetical protein EVJ58_g7464 [Rhodofomes roseus]
MRGRKPDPRESSSPEIQIIEKPAAFDENKNKNRDHDKSKSQAKHQKKSKAQTRGRSTDLDAERPRKKRKTDGDKVAETVKRPVKKPRKSEGAAASKSQKGKQPAKGSSDSSPQAGPSPQEDDRIIADHPLCKWPDTISGDENYQREFINCDNCDAWFHYGCVGLAADDPRLTEEDSKFFCPPCEVATEEREGQHASQQNKTAQCARPDCQSSETGQWFIECIVGRRPSLTQPSNNGVPKFLWLVKWSGYEMKDATWEFPENLGDPAQLVSEFEVAAELENKDLSDPHKPTLLNEAAKCWS